MSTTTEVLSSAHSTLESHAQLMKAVHANHERRRHLLAMLPSSSTTGISFPDLPPRPDSPESTKSESYEYDPHMERYLKQLNRTDVPKEKMEKLKRYRNYVPEEETIRNDYSQQYVDSGEWPQNWVLGAELEKRFEEYPKQQKLLALKQMAVTTQAHPPTHLPLSSLQSLHPMKFDVVLIDPPYADTTRDPPYGGIAWDQIAELPIPALAGDPSFIFMWVGHGNSDGLERGREVLSKWGFRRCEDIVWVKTNKLSNRGPGTDPPPIGGVMTRTTEHCLMGIKGTVRRSTDGWFVHCNIDSDVIIWEGDPTDGLRKPPEMYSLIENFCLGTRRLEIFGRASSLRRGWVTCGDLDDAAYELEKVNGRAWDKELYESDIRQSLTNGRAIVSTSTEIEQLRPKTPPPKDRNNHNSGNFSHNPTPIRGGTPAQVNQGMGFNPGMPMMQGGMMGPMAGGGMQGPMPMMTAGFDGGFPQGEMMMNMASMGMGNAGGTNRNMMRGGVPPAMGPMGGNMGTNPTPLNIPQNGPIRLGGGPMQAIQTMQAPMNSVMPGMGPGMMPNMNMGGTPMMSMGGQPMNMGMMGSGMMNAPMPGMMGQGMMGMPAMGGQPMQMGNMGMGMGMNMAGNMTGGPNGMMFGNGPNGNRGWQQGGNPNGNWTGGSGGNF